MMRSMRGMVSLTIGLLLMAAPRMSSASEGAQSYYFPGSLGSFAVAVAPEPGLLIADSTFILDAKVDRAVLQGKLNANLEITGVFNVLAGQYTLQTPVLGARLTVGGMVFVPAYVDIEATLGSGQFSKSDTGLGDALLMPAAFHWKAGDFHFKLAELVFMPTGHYDKDSKVNVGRNYWAFDTFAAATYLNMNTGTEVSVVPGFMTNTENDITHYRTGNEFHLDFMLNQFLAKSFALGFQGYYYQQVSGDSGSGATLGDFEGESVGVGPALLWLPPWCDDKLVLSGKWLTDLDAEKRIESDWFLTTIAYRF